MFGALAKSIFGSSNERYVKSLGKIVERIASFESSIEVLSDDDLVAQTVRFRERLAAGETLDDLLPEAFATVREASKRVLGMRHFDVQMVGGIVLHRGFMRRDLIDDPAQRLDIAFVGRTENGLGKCAEHGLSLSERT